MRIHLLLYTICVFLVPAIASSSHAPPTVKRYYSDSPEGGHLDARYASQLNLYRSQRRLAMIDLTRSYRATMADLGITTWLAHGTLLGWHWGQQPLPWDAGIDVHISFANLTFLAAYYSMTVHAHGASRYLLDINPRYVERDGSVDVENVIDARWIDMENGLYVDVAAVVDVTAVADGLGEDRAVTLVAKDGHTYAWDAVFPLHESTFQNIRACVPRNAEAILAQEYGEDALRRKVFRGYG
ncbi:hypothetical protein MMC18_009657 [Xylographa bjoerkii]|nr:hypothetical protein [Xylographa bjoerkii]